MSKDFTYMVTAAPGLEDIVVSEILNKLPRRGFRPKCGAG